MHGKALARNKPEHRFFSGTGFYAVRQYYMHTFYINIQAFLSTKLCVYVMSWCLRRV